MILKDFKLQKEHPDKYDVVHPSGKTISVSKKGLTDKAHGMIKSLKSVENFDEGGGVPDPTPTPIILDPNRLPVGQAPEPSPMPAQQPAWQPKPVFTPSPTDVLPGQSPTNQELTKGDQSSGGNDPQAAVSSAQNNSFEQEKQALFAQAGAHKKQAGEEREAFNDLAVKQLALPSQQDIQTKYDARDKELEQAFQSGKIDPDRYIHNMGTGSKIAAGIGLLLGGVGAGLTHGRNVAADMLQSSINADIDAQKNDQSKTMNLWKMNREALGSDLAANLATQNQMYTGLKYKLMQAAGQTNNVVAQQAAMAGAAQIDQKRQMNNAILGFQHVLTGQAGAGGEQNFINNMNAAQRLSPEMAKDAADKYIPNIGITRTKVDKEDRDTFASLDNLQKQIDKAKAFAAEKGTTLGFGTKATQEANDIQNQLQLEVGNLVNLKRINEFEAHKYTDMIQNPGAWNTGKALQSFNDFESAINEKKKSEMNKLGVMPFQKAPVNNQALSWAKANPQDPRSAQILQKLGAK